MTPGAADTDMPGTAAFPGTDAFAALRHLASPDLDPLFRSCERVDRESAWFGHLPFAHWLIRAARPRLLVELGTYAGVSYAAFCQAIEAERLDARCYAVDTWRGDPQAGHYDESVYEDLRRYHDGRFAAFSQMLRSTFDEALDRFADGSVDLLHIDGLHTYDAVRHDFESWLPKLSDRAVVLFHDTNERQADFGVWRFWSEVSGRWPAFEFRHAHGLGVLCVGRHVPRAMLDLCALQDTEAATIRDRFSRLGERWEPPILPPEVREQLARVPDLEVALDAAATERAELTRRLSGLEAELSRVLALQRQQQDERRAQQSAWATERGRWASERDDLLSRLAMASEFEWRSTEADRLIRAMHASTSWRVTTPLRWLSTALRPRSERGRLLARAVTPAGGEARRIIGASLLRRLGRKARSTEVMAEATDYTLWRRRFDTPKAEDLERLAATASQRPAAVIVLACTPDTQPFLERTIASLRLCIGLDFTLLPVMSGCKPAEAARLEALLRDAGLPVTCADRIPEDGPLILLESGALPRAHGPRLLADALLASPGTVLAYGDEDVLSAEGVLESPFFKPRFSPRLAEAGLLLGRMVALRGAAAGLLRRHLAEGTDPDLALAARDAALAAGEQGVAHVPHVLFANAMPRPAPRQAARPLPDPLPRVSIFIPTRNGWSLLGPCLESLRSTDWPRDRLEVIVVDNGSTEADARDGLAAAEAAGHIRLIRDPRPFNYARLNNVAARIATGDFFVLLNNDTIVREAGWLREMIAEAAVPGTGAVGAKLLYPDGTVQHGGVVLGVQGGCVHAHHGLDARDGGYAGLANLNHEIAANTGACLAVRRDAYLAVGGLDERLRVAFNDVVFCLDLHDSGLRNVYVGRPLITHFESKTRGLDNTPEKVRVVRNEMAFSWSRHAALLRDDPFYSPNLSLEATYAYAFAPRRRAAWLPPVGRSLRVLMLSSTHARGHGVAVVIDQQVRALAEAGHEILLAGHRSDGDFDYGGRAVIEVHDPRIAARLAVERAVDVIVAHTPPFFSVSRWTGAYPPLIAYDYGEPPPDLFPDAAQRREVMADRRHAFCAATRVVTISDAVSAESPVEPDAVAPLANSHLGRWNADMQGRRADTRAARGWQDRFVVLNVCRFHAGERLYKGVDTYADLLPALLRLDPVVAARTVLVLCGKGNADDVAAMQARGIVVAANVSDEEMADLYAAADAYANFSLWEGYNLGIGQALAMGLPVVASDIPAHRAFGVRLARDAEDAAGALIAFAGSDAPRVARIWEWSAVLPAFVAEVEGVARGELGRTNRASSWAELAADAGSEWSEAASTSGR